MDRHTVETGMLSFEQYWKLFTRLIESAKVGTTAACLGWIFYWFGYVPDINNAATDLAAGISVISLVAAIAYGAMAGALLLGRGRGLGTRRDRLWLALQSAYSILAGLAGLASHLTYPIFA